METSSPAASRTPLWHAMQSPDVAKALACSPPGCGVADQNAALVANPTQMKMIRRRMIYKAFWIGAAPLYCRACSLQEKAARQPAPPNALEDTLLRRGAARGQRASRVRFGRTPRQSPRRRAARRVFWAH